MDSTKNSSINEVDRYLLILIFLVGGAYGYYEALSFGGNTGIWPQMLSAFIFVGATLLMLQNYLPESARRIIADSSEMIRVDQDFENKEGEDESKATETADELPKQGIDRPLDDTVFAVVAITGYVVLGYLIGLLWAAPVFIVVYTYWFRMRWYLIIGLSVTGFAISYAFMNLMYLPLDEGILFGGI